MLCLGSIAIGCYLLALYYNPGLTFTTSGMYSKQQASQIRQNFWTSFGQYMRPVTGAGGELVNWINYKTGLKFLFFRLDADKNEAAVSIELRHPDIEMQEHYFQQFISVRNLLENALGESWEWEREITDDDGRVISRIGTRLTGVNIFNQEDWPAIISFFKPRLIALDDFWDTVKDSFQ